MGFNNKFLPQETWSQIGSPVMMCSAWHKKNSTQGGNLKGDSVKKSQNRPA